MENATGGGWTNNTQFIEYKVSVVMWKFMPPLIIVLGTFGNLATILVMSRIKDNNSSQYAVLMALAIADLSVLYFGLLDIWMMNVYHVYLISFHTVLCKFYSWASFAAVTTSAWLVTTVTVQRTMAVLWPHKMRMMCTVRRTWIVIVVVVIIACSVHIHLMIGVQLTVENECIVSGWYGWFYKYIWRWVVMCISCFVPSACLFVCSIILSWTLFRSASLSSTAVHATSHTYTGHSHDSRKRDAVKVTVMILSLSCTFLVLTLPAYSFDVWYDHTFVSTKKPDVMSFLFYTVSYLMLFSNSAVNFFLYCLTGTRFRKEFMSLLLCATKGHTVGETTAVTLRGGKNKQQNSTPLST